MNVDMNKEIESKIKDIVKQVTNFEGDTVDIDLNEELISTVIDSVSFIKIVVAIESEFGFEFDDENLDFNKYRSLNDLISYIEDKIQK